MRLSTLSDCEDDLQAEGQTHTAAQEGDRKDNSMTTVPWPRWIHPAMAASINHANALCAVYRH